MKSHSNNEYKRDNMLVTLIDPETNERHYLEMTLDEWTRKILKDRVVCQYYTQYIRKLN